MSAAVVAAELAPTAAQISKSASARQPLLEFTWFFSRGPLRKNIPNGITVRIGPVAAGVGVFGAVTGVLGALGYLDDIGDMVGLGSEKKKERPLGTKWYDYIPVVGGYELLSGKTV